LVRTKSSSIPLPLSSTSMMTVVRRDAGIGLPCRIESLTKPSSVNCSDCEESAFDLSPQQEMMKLTLSELPMRLSSTRLSPPARRKRCQRSLVRSKLGVKLTRIHPKVPSIDSLLHFQYHIDLTGHRRRGLANVGRDEVGAAPPHPGRFCYVLANLAEVADGQCGTMM